MKKLVGAVFLFLLALYVAFSNQCEPGDPSCDINKPTIDKGREEVDANEQDAR